MDNKISICFYSIVHLEDKFFSSIALTKKHKNYYNVDEKKLGESRNLTAIYNVVLYGNK